MPARYMTLYWWMSESVSWPLISGCSPSYPPVTPVEKADAVCEVFPLASGNMEDEDRGFESLLTLEIRRLGRGDDLFERICHASFTSSLSASAGRIR